jgi:hypothetical protein
MALPSFPQTGGCICGAVRYQLTAPPLAVYRCHCKDCQRHSGGPFSMSMVIDPETLEVSGELAHYDKTADSGRVIRQFFCPVCDTRVYHQPMTSPQLVLKPGTLDDLSWAVPVGSIWTASAMPWVTIPEDEPNFAGQAPSREKLMAAWRGRFIDP